MTDYIIPEVTREEAGYAARQVIEEGMQREFYPCKPDIFAATYEPAETAPVDGEHS